MIVSDETSSTTGNISVGSTRCDIEMHGFDEADRERIHQIVGAALDEVAHKMVAFYWARDAVPAQEESPSRMADKSEIEDLATAFSGMVEAAYAQAPLAELRDAVGEVYRIAGRMGYANTGRGAMLALFEIAHRAKDPDEVNPPVHR